MLYQVSCYIEGFAYIILKSMNQHILCFSKTDVLSKVTLYEGLTVFDVKTGKKNGPKKDDVICERSLSGLKICTCEMSHI